MAYATLPAAAVAAVVVAVENVRCSCESVVVLLVVLNADYDALLVHSVSAVAAAPPACVAAAAVVIAVVHNQQHLRAIDDADATDCSLMATAASAASVAHCISSSQAAVSCCKLADVDVADSCAVAKVSLTHVAAVACCAMPACLWHLPHSHNPCHLTRPLFACPLTASA